MRFAVRDHARDRVTVRLQDSWTKQYVRVLFHHACGGNFTERRRTAVIAATPAVREAREARRSVLRYS